MNLTCAVSCLSERGHWEGARVGTAGSHRGQSQRKGEGGAEGPIRTDQRDRQREGAAQEGGGHPAFQSPHVRYGEILHTLFFFRHRSTSVFYLVLFRFFIIHPLSLYPRCVRTQRRNTKRQILFIFPCQIIIVFFFFLFYLSGAVIRCDVVRHTSQPAEGPSLGVGITVGKRREGEAV